MKSTLLLIIYLNCILNAFSQDIELLHQDNKVKIKKISGYDMSSDFIRTNDNSMLITYRDYDSIFKILNINKNTDIVNQYEFLENKNSWAPFYFDNNKFYSFDIRAKMFSINGESYYYIDTLKLVCYNTSGGIIYSNVIQKMLNDTIQWNVMDSKILNLENKEFLFVNVGLLTNENYSETSAFRIIKTDTLGNVLKSKIYYDTISEFNLCEIGNHVLLGKSPKFASTDRFKIYYINKNTLEIDDSILFYSKNMRKINDSIFFCLGFDIKNTPPIYGQVINQFNIINKNTKEIKNITYFPLNGQEQGKWSELVYLPHTGERVDFTNTDSVYLVYNVRNASGYPDGNLSGNLEIVNFNANTRDTNFVYRMDFDTTSQKHLQGLKATTDGGLIMLAYAGDNNSSVEDVWLIKFMPNGFVGLTNIETNEKASLKVYPNPSKDIINVDIEADRFSSSEIELFDIQGRLVKKSKLNAQIGNRIDVSTLNPGAYTYRVVINGKGISGKVIIGE